MLLRRYDLRKNFPNGDRYNGEATENNVFEGQGTYVWSNGSSYVGEWKKGQFDGRGTYVVVGTEGYQFVGSFLNGKQSGHGRCRFASGREYVGEWADGLMHTSTTTAEYRGGPGDDFVRYVGTMERGLLSGAGGTYECTNGDTYCGAFRENHPHGAGEMIFGEEKRTKLGVVSFKGAFVDGQSLGLGDLCFNDGAHYRGGVRGYEPQGKGTLTRASTHEVHTGEFQHGKRAGEGEWCLDGSEARYAGRWMEDLWHGFGEYTSSARMAQRRDAPKPLMVRCIGTFEYGFLSDVNGTVEYVDGSVYKGAVAKDRRHGKGQQRGGALHIPGAGEYSILMYDGEFVAGVRCGAARCEMTLRQHAIPSPGSTAQNVYDAPSVVYCGEWAKDLPNGVAVVDWTGQYHYEGPVRNGLPSSLEGYPHGHLVHIKQWSYEGALEQGQRHGKGRCDFENSDSYDGEWSGNVIYGYGVHRSAKGAVVYEGEWRDGERHGTGTEVTDSGTTYKGQFQRGQKCGQGTLSFDKKRVSYTGEFANGSFHGQGLLIQGDGSRFQGTFVSGLAHGMMTEVTLTNGNHYSGHMNKGHITGHGRMRYPNSDSYEGKFVNGERHGAGKFCFSEGTVLECVWKRNVLNGQGVYTDRHGVKSAREYAEGLLVTRRLDPSGKLPAATATVPSCPTQHKIPTLPTANAECAETEEKLDDDTNEATQEQSPFSDGRQRDEVSVASLQPIDPVITTAPVPPARVPSTLDSREVTIRQLTSNISAANVSIEQMQSNREISDVERRRKLALLRATRLREAKQLLRALQSS